MASHIFYQRAPGRSSGTASVTCAPKKHATSDEQPHRAIIKMNLVTREGRRVSVRRGVLLLDRETRAPTHVTSDADNAHSPKHMHTRASLPPFTFAPNPYSHDRDRDRAPANIRTINTRPSPASNE